jgi:hypothetical protein
MSRYLSSSDSVIIDGEGVKWFLTSCVDAISFLPAFFVRCAKYYSCACVLGKFRAVRRNYQCCDVKTWCMIR